MKMRRHAWWLAAVAACLASTAFGQGAQSALQKAQAALGGLHSVQFSGGGVNGNYGQALSVDKEWPRRDLKSFSESINYDQKAAQLNVEFAQPTFGGQKQNYEVSGDRAWTVGPMGIVPQLATAQERQLQIWMSPAGFVSAGLAASDAKARSATVDGQKVTIVSFTAMDKFPLRGTIDSNGLVTRVQTKFSDPVLGDINYEFLYSDYRDSGTGMFPMHIVQNKGDYMVYDLTVSNVQPNASVDVPVPAEVASATSPMKVDTRQVADGVWFVGGTTHHSVVVEFKNFIVVLEAPLTEARSLAVIAEARRLVPGKPIRYLVQTHHHFDHMGGVRTYVAQGIPVVINQSDIAYFTKATQAPATIEPDMQSKAHRKPTFHGVTNDKPYVITDGTQRIEVYSTIGDHHTDELDVSYILPSKVLVEADSYSPQPNAKSPADPVPPNAQVLYDNIQRLHLQPATVIGIHGSGPVPYEDFLKFIGKD